MPDLWDSIIVFPVFTLKEKIFISSLISIRNAILSLFSHMCVFVCVIASIPGSLLPSWQGRDF